MLYMTYIFNVFKATLKACCCKIFKPAGDGDLVLQHIITNEKKCTVYSNKDRANVYHHGMGLLIYIYYIYLLRTRSTLHRNKGTNKCTQKKGKMQTHHDIMLATQRLFTTETRLLHLVAGNVNKDICNFICGETRTIIVHELFNCRTSGGGLRMIKWVVALQLFKTTTPSGANNFGIDTHDLHLVSTHAHL